MGMTGELQAIIGTADVYQLVEWGNVAPLRLEPRRTETRADRRLQKPACLTPKMDKRAMA
jgi:hypothetical protein